MAKKDWKAIVTDKNEIAKLELEFQKNREKISQKIYTSVTEERLRTNKIITTDKIKAPVEKVFQAVINQACKDLHSSLNYEDLVNNSFYRTSGKTNKIPFKITEFKINEVLSVEYYAKDQQFIKTLRFKTNKKKQTKILYTDIAVGMVSVLGWFEKHIRQVYVKRQIIAFKTQILKAKLDLKLIPEKYIGKKENEITRMLDYSQKAF